MSTTYSEAEYGPLLTPECARERLRQAHALERALATLAVLRLKGGGPPFVKVGRTIRYPRKPLDKWARKLNAVELRQVTPVSVRLPPAAVTATTPITALPLPALTRNALRRAGIEDAGQLRAMDDAALLAIGRIGERGLAAIRGLLLVEVRRPLRVQRQPGTPEPESEKLA